jgi:hypothetical protein
VLDLESQLALKEADHFDVGPYIHIFQDSVRSIEGLEIHYSNINYCTSLDKPGQAWTSLDKPGQAWTSLDKPGPVWTSLDQPGQAWTSQD